MADFEQTRPTFFNVLRIAFPVGAVTSFAHRVSGIVLVVWTERHAETIRIISARFATASGGAS